MIHHADSCLHIFVLKHLRKSGPPASPFPAPHPLHELGVPQVYLASSAPPVRFPNVYGVDMPNRKEFVAHGLTEDQVGALIACHASVVSWYSPTVGHCLAVAASLAEAISLCYSVCRLLC
jgi:hypothetical protein